MELGPSATEPSPLFLKHDDSKSTLGRLKIQVALCGLSLLHSALSQDIPGWVVPPDGCQREAVMRRLQNGCSGGMVQAQSRDRRRSQAKSACFQVGTSPPGLSRNAACLGQWGGCQNSSLFWGRDVVWLLWTRRGLFPAQLEGNTLVRRDIPKAVPIAKPRVCTSGRVHLKPPDFFPYSS